jgi:hypothetical protein
MEFDIYELLRSGRTSEDIAAEFAKNLNEAEETIRKEEEAKAAAEKAANAAKRTELKDALTLLISWFKKYYPEYADTEDLDLTDEDLDAIIDLISSLLDLEKIKASFSFGPMTHFFEKPKATRTKAPTDTPVTTDDVFSSFFKTFGI